MLPASKSATNYFASPRSAVGFLVHAANLDTSVLGDNRAMMMPGVWGTVGDEIDALRRVAGDEIVALIKDEPDPVIEKCSLTGTSPTLQVPELGRLVLTLKIHLMRLFRSILMTN